MRITPNIMFTNTIRKTASKLIMLSMLVSAFTPFTGFVHDAASAPLTGMLTIGFDHALGGFTVTNGNGVQIADRNAGDCPRVSGYYTCHLQLETGPYLVEFKDITSGPAYVTPQNVVVNLRETGVTVQRDYVFAGGPSTGTLYVGINNSLGGFTVTNGNMVVVADKTASQCPSQSGYFVCNFTLETGPYLIEFHDIPGYRTPADVIVHLSNTGGSILRDYELNGPTTGELSVGMNILSGGFILTNGNQIKVAEINATECGPKQANGYYVCRIPQALPTGPYLVEFKDVVGYTAPNNIVVQLTATGGTVFGTYVSDGPSVGILGVGVNNAQGGFIITNGNQQVVSNKNAADCNIQDGYYVCEGTFPTGPYLVTFKNVPGYITPANIVVSLSRTGGTVFGYYALNPTGAIQVNVVDELNQPIVDLPADEWQLKKCSSADPGSCTNTMMTGGPANFMDGLGFATYRIVFPSPTLPAGYSGRTVIPSMYQVLNSNATYLLFTIKYTRATQSDGVAYVNVRTTPVQANVRMVTTSPAQPDQQAVTSDLVNGLPTYDLADADRFTLPTTPTGFTALTNYYIVCPPAPGGYLAPSSNIVVNGAQYAMNSENLAGTCVYTNTTQKVTISIDTIGISAAAIYVDGVEVRATTNSDEVFVQITTEEQHVISFEDKDPANFTAPENIVIPANSLNTGMTADELRYLGYYVAHGNLAVAEVNTENQNGWVYLTIGNDPTLWNVGYADTTPTPLIVHFNEAIAHGFRFQDRNAPVTPSYYLRAVPVFDPGFSVSQTISQIGNNITHFQEHYSYAGGEALDTVYLTGDYIAYGNAAFFRARTTNADPIYGEIYLDINGEAPETLIPGAQTWTRVFISDVVNDNDTTRFQSPITVNTLGYTAVPASYDLSTFSPGTVINDLESTYMLGGTTTDLTVQLISTHPLIQPTPGLIVTLDGTINQPTTNNAGNIETTFTSIDPNSDHTVTCPAIAGLVTPNDLLIPAGILTPGENFAYCIYVPLATAAEILIETQANDNINFSAPVTLTINGIDYFLGWTDDSVAGTPATLSAWIDTAASNVIVYGNMPGYTTPAPQTVNVNPGTSWRDPNPNNVFNGLYVRPGANETVTITAYDETGVNILNTVDITVNGTVVSTNGQYSAQYPVGTVLNIEFEDVSTHGIPRIDVNGVSVGNTHTTVYTVLAGPSPNTVEAFYGIDSNSVGFNVGTRDNQNNVLNQDIVHGPNGTETTVATPVFFTVTQTGLSDYVINFTNRTGYITPGSVTIHNQAIASIPSNVTIANNGTAYTAGTPLVLGDTYDIVGTYIPYFTIEKNIISEQTIVNNNKRVDYQIVVTRHPSSPVGAMSIILQDTLAPSRSLTGSNGGTMSVVSQNGQYSVCSNNCGDITAGPVTVPIDNPGNSVTITYQLLSNNSAIPAGQSSNFTNTLTGTFTHNTEQITMTDSVTVNVQAFSGSGPVPGPSGGGTSGGGAVIIRGDMILEITKLVSLDKRNWVDASDEENALTIPERVESTLYTKVKVKNLGQVTATNIRFSEGFDEHDSKISSDEIRNVQGETGFSYNETTGIIRIDQLTVGGEINFSYEQILDEKGSRGELAEEYLILEGFSTRLTANQDGLTKHGIGDHYPSWLVAGEPTTVVSEGNLLELSITTDKAAARVGEEVTYTITAKNNADFDFTGVIISWDYDENALEILNPFGGRDTGTEIHWNRGTLKPGQTVSYTVRTRVSNTAPVGGNVRTTARGLVNEIENPATVDHYLTIIAGISPGPIKLAQTGMPTLLLVLASLFGYFAYTNTGRRRYLALKKAALRPL